MKIEYIEWISNMGQWMFNICDLYLPEDYSTHVLPFEEFSIEFNSNIISLQSVADARKQVPSTSLIYGFNFNELLFVWGFRKSRQLQRILFISNV